MHLTSSIAEKLTNAGGRRKIFCKFSPHLAPELLLSCSRGCENATSFPPNPVCFYSNRKHICTVRSSGGWGAITLIQLGGTW